MYALASRLLPSRLVLGLAVGLLSAHWALAQDVAAIRKNIAERMPDFPKIEEVTKSPIPGLYEIRVDGDLFYTDEKGDYLVQGQILDTKTKVNITQAKLDKINAIDFASLPLKDAVVWKQGNGKRKLAIFADPNCGYCKRFEKTLQDVKDVTVYTFVIPILGGDSPEKAKAVWCSKDRTSAWRNWMLNGAPLQRAMGPCDTSAIDRNLALAQKHHVTGTPNVVFEGGYRAPGALPLADVEKHLNEGTKG
jgi:thiol:disulfide interchange protein DsbC